MSVSSKSAGDTINTAFKAKIGMLKNEERIGSMMYYDNILKGVTLFAGEKIPFENITLEWLKRYEKFVLFVRKRRERQKTERRYRRLLHRRCNK